ncbi:hypothetical protein EJ05DRAFT_380637 [Pseudovirgaria hyperparasitica]|uniref:Uncharacterized protein n=1 Tax=Pseudovirgaria hyperparasitica TaxID=470096 RepID=A0A6A6W7L4_9PEZI|nr:uncharacterized protein EJ05DRAFT_380637 [Pseudovirgaria hyperparasitica]KAF2758199.1 hypothetical protein EJ05DRAFT_380637 [Pseudovirgaria hyperparasitica]
MEGRSVKRDVFVTLVSQNTKSLFMFSSLLPFAAICFAELSLHRLGLSRMFIHLLTGFNGLVRRDTTSHILTGLTRPGASRASHTCLPCVLLFHNADFDNEIDPKSERMDLEEKERKSGQKRNGAFRLSLFRMR